MGGGEGREKFGGERRQRVMGKERRKRGERILVPQLPAFPESLAKFCPETARKYSQLPPELRLRNRGT